MIEQSLQNVKSKKSSKGKKKAQQKSLSEGPPSVEKIHEESKSISELSQPDEKEERKTQAEKFYELTEDIVCYLLLDHEQFKQEIQSLLSALKHFNLQKITHKQIMAYSFWAKIIFIEQKLKQSQVKFDKHIVEKQKEKLAKKFKDGLRQFKYFEKYYKDYRSAC